MILKSISGLFSLFKKIVSEIRYLFIATGVSLLFFFLFTINIPFYFT
jgi:hypothetical protein